MISEENRVTERDRTVAGALEKGSRVMVLHNLDGKDILDHRHPVLTGPAIVDLMCENGLFGVFMVLDFQPEPLRSAVQIGVIVHISQLSPIHPGLVVSYDERNERNAQGDMVVIPAMDWTDDGVVVCEEPL